MSERILYRLVGIAAMGCATIVGLVHLLAVAGSPPAAGLSIVLWTLPVLIPTALAYIAAAHRSRSSLRPPAWAIALWTASAAYGAINFELERRATQGGDITIINSRPVLTVHGQPVRTLSPEDARTVESWKVRGISGDLLPLFVLPGVGLLVLAPRARATGRREHAA